jgi:translation elongation factor EF-G
MKKISVMAFAILALFQIATAQIDLKKSIGKVVKDVKETAGNIKTGNNPLSNEDIGNGLKEALKEGVGKGVTSLSALDGYYKSALYKILIPEDMKNVVSKLKKVPGFGNIENEIMEKMNRGAEKAAVKAKPIFVNAITSLSFSDALNILMGEKNAATQYLNTTTNEALYKEFSPVISSSLAEVGATKYWSDAVNAYNKIPLVKKANPDLTDYVTKEALKGMFGMVAEKELEIRDNPALRATDLLKKVFAKQDKK